MTSTKQIQANRENAQHSTGPRTPEGKERVRANDLKHGLTGQFALLPHEDRAAYEALAAAIIKELAPEGAIETDLARSIANDRWRLNRARAIEDNVFALGYLESQCDAAFDPAEYALAQARTFLDQSKHFALLTLYAQRIQRALEKNTAELRRLQAERAAARHSALVEAVTLLQLAEFEHRPIDPEEILGENGFGFSIDELRREITRRQRLMRAAQMAQHGSRPSEPAIRRPHDADRTQVVRPPPFPSV